MKIIAFIWKTPKIIIIIKPRPINFLDIRFFELTLFNAFYLIFLN